jgi:hypothetical protein
VALPVGLNIVGGTLVIVPVLFAVTFPASGNDAEGGHSLLGIHVSLPPGSPGSQGIQLVVIVRAQYPVGEPEIPPAAFVAPEFGKGFKVQFGGMGICLLHPGGLSEDIIAIGFPVLLLGFVAFPAKLNKFGEAGLCCLVMVCAGNVPVVLPDGK